MFFKSKTNSFVLKRSKTLLFLLNGNLKGSDKAKVSIVLENPGANWTLSQGPK